MRYALRRNDFDFVLCIDVCVVDSDRFMLELPGVVEEVGEVVVGMCGDVDNSPG